MPKMQLLKKKDANNNVDDLGFTVTQAEIDTWNTVTNHEHNYLPLTAGEEKTITGNLYVKQSSGNGNIIIGNGPVLLGASTGNLAISPKAGGIIYLRPQGSTVSTGALAIKNGLVYPAIDKQVSLGDSSNTFNNIYGTTIYQNGNQVANKADLDSYLPLSGGKLTGTVTMTGGDFIANYVAVKAATHETGEYNKIATLSSNGYIRYRSKSELVTDLNVPTLNTDGKLDTSVLPAIAITDTYECSTEAEMLALSAQQGDVCIRSDLNKSFILKAVPATELSNWAELRTPTDHVLSVNGKTGAVSLAIADLTDGATLIEAISTEWCI